MGNEVKSKPALVVPAQLKWHQKLAGNVIHWVARIFMATWRVCYIDDTKLSKGIQSPLIFCIWHNRLALSMIIYHDYVKRTYPSAGLSAMISASRDGGLLAYVLERFEVTSIRGSSSRRGRQALLEATTALEIGNHVAITPDGPRGPAYQIQDGIIALAQLTGCPIIPVTCTVRGKWEAKSWDRFQIPHPFTRCDVTLHEVVRVPREATDAERGQIAILLKDRMQPV